MRPPQNAIDAPAVYVLGSDPAWDEDRIETELEIHAMELLEGMDEGDMSATERREHALDLARRAHPRGRYLNGETRYDLNAPIEYRGEVVRIPEYFGREPVKYTLRRLRIQQLAEITDEMGRIARQEHPQHAAVYTRCARLGIVKISDNGVQWDTRAGQPTEESMRRLYDAHGLGAIMMLGIAVWTFSQPLGPAEKKR